MIHRHPFVFVPDNILHELFIQAKKDKGPIPIRGTINDKPYRQTLVKYSGAWRLYVSMVMLKDSPRRIGELIEVTVVGKRCYSILLMHLRPRP